MTSLIDVIFLLLLFFMLSSTFSRFAEVELMAAGGGGSAPQRVVFLRLSGDGVTVNGSPVGPEALGPVLADLAGRATLLVSVAEGATAQALTDVLVTAQALPDLSLSVLEGS